MKKNNYLDKIPLKNPKIMYNEKDGIITLDMPHRGPINKLFQLVFRTPPISHVTLEKYGSFVWNHIDGESTIYEIGYRLETRFGDAAAPIYERLSKFIMILRNNRLIIYKEV